MSQENPGDDIRCDWCDALGEPYEYKGKQFSGLIPYYGEKVCPRCTRHDREDRATKNPWWEAPIDLRPARALQLGDGRDKLSDRAIKKRLQQMSERACK